MHFNFHLDGTESQEQTRRIANAVLALGGAVPENVLTPSDIRGILGTEAEPALDNELSDIVRTSPMATMAQALREKADGERRLEVVDPATGVQLTDNASRTEAQTAEIKTAVTVPPIPITPAPATTDAKGLPWDERIHSSSRAVNADGTWRYRKNVPDETKLAVEHELRSFTVETVPTQEVVTAGGAVEVPLAPIVPAIPAVTVPPPPVVAANVERKYPDVVNLIMARKIPAEMYVAILGTDLPTFATTCKSDPTAATRMFEALDQASRPA